MIKLYIQVQLYLDGTFGRLINSLYTTSVLKKHILFILYIEILSIYI
jgi:hypothetical protein